MLNVNINATFKGNAYSAISIWLEDITTKGEASQAWMTNFSVRDGKTTCQINYSVPLAKVKLWNVATSAPAESNTNSSTTTNTDSVINGTTNDQASTGGTR